MGVAVVYYYRCCYSYWNLPLWLVVDRYVARYSFFCRLSTRSNLYAKMKEFEIQECTAVYDFEICKKRLTILTTWSYKIVHYTLLYNFFSIHTFSACPVNFYFAPSIFFILLHYCMLSYPLRYVSALAHDLQYTKSNNDEMRGARETAPASKPLKHLKSSSPHK